MYDSSTAEVFCRYDIRRKDMALPDMHSSVLQSTDFLRLYSVKCLEIKGATSKAF